MVCRAKSRRGKAGPPVVSRWPFEGSVAGLIQQVQLVCSTGNKTYDWSREFVFHPTRKWRFDVAIHKPRIALEYQGIFIHGGGKGGHQTISGMQRDMEKINESQLLGWMILLFDADSVRSGEALVVIKRALELRSSKSRLG